MENKRSIERLSRFKYSMTCEVGKPIASEALDYGRGRSLTRDKIRHCESSSKRSYDLDLFINAWEGIFWLGNKE